MDEETGFLEAITAAPEDAIVRRIYADWLAERGDPRAEILRLLLALEALERDDSGAEPLLADLRQLQVQTVLERSWFTLMLRGQISRLLRAFQAGEPRQNWLQSDLSLEVARRWEALPLYSDWDGFLLLRPDGELVGLWDDGEEPQLQRVAPGTWRLIALVSGAEFFPELRPLLPMRPPGAHPCLRCQGKGFERWWIEEKKGITPYAECGGLGWVPPRPDRKNPCPKCHRFAQIIVPDSSGRDQKKCPTCYGWGWSPEEWDRQVQSASPRGLQDWIQRCGKFAGNLRTWLRRVTYRSH